MGPQPFLCVLQMKKGRLIKRSRGRRQAGRPEGFVPLFVYVCECVSDHVCMSGHRSHEILLFF